MMAAVFFIMLGLAVVDFSLIMTREKRFIFLPELLGIIITRGNIFDRSLLLGLIAVGIAFLFVS